MSILARANQELILDMNLQNGLGNPTLTRSWSSKQGPPCFVFFYEQHHTYVTSGSNVGC